MKEKKNIGVMVLLEDKELIEKASKEQRRSVASFIVESSIIRAREVLRNSQREAIRGDDRQS